MGKVVGVASEIGGGLRYKWECRGRGGGNKLGRICFLYIFWERCFFFFFRWGHCFDWCHIMTPDLSHHICSMIFNGVSFFFPRPFSWFLIPSLLRISVVTS